MQHLIAQESDCCYFLAFGLRNDAATVRLTITAPIEPLPAADELFAHFVPHLASRAVG